MVACLEHVASRKLRSQARCASRTRFKTAQSTGDLRFSKIIGTYLKDEALVQEIIRFALDLFQFREKIATNNATLRTVFSQKSVTLHANSDR